MGLIGPEQLELFALEVGKIATLDFVYSLASTNINQSAPDSSSILPCPPENSGSFLSDP